MGLHGPNLFKPLYLWNKGLTQKSTTYGTRNFVSTFPWYQIYPDWTKDLGAYFEKHRKQANFAIFFSRALTPISESALPLSVLTFGHVTWPELSVREVSPQRVIRVREHSLYMYLPLFPYITQQSHHFVCSSFTHSSRGALWREKFRPNITE